MTSAQSALPEHVPVCIVGAGPVGLATACLLARAGVRVLVLERAEALFPLPRAIVLDDEGLRALHAIDLDARLLALTVPGEGSRYYSATGVCFAETGAGPETYGYPKRNFLHQPDLEQALLDRARQMESIDLRFGHEVTDIAPDADGVQLRVKNAEGAAHNLRTDWLLGCDGGRSTVRTELGIAMQGNTYGQEWVVVDCLNDPDDTLYSKFFCDPARPHVSIPAPRCGRRYEFMVLPGEDAKDLLEDAALSRFLAPFRPFAPEMILRRAIYTFHARIAERWQAGRVLLMGDAAHLTPPFAGQGMNAGLRDAQNLSWKLALVVRDGADPAILASYEAERRGPAWAMIQLAVAMGQVVMPDSEEQARILDAMMTALKPFPAARDYLIQMRFKPRPRCEAGLFLDLDAQPMEGSLVGEMLPQPRLGDGVMLDTHLGRGFALVTQDERVAAALRAHRHPLWDLLCPTNVKIDLPMSAGGDPRLKPLRTHRDQVLIVRPDRYVAAACFASDLDQTADRLVAALGLATA